MWIMCIYKFLHIIIIIMHNWKFEYHFIYVLHLIKVALYANSMLLLCSIALIWILKVKLPKYRLGAKFGPENLFNYTAPLCLVWSNWMIVLFKQEQLKLLFLFTQHLLRWQPPVQPCLEPHHIAFSLALNRLMACWLQECAAAVIFHGLYAFT